MTTKSFALDTNVLLETENALEIIINGKDGGDVNKIYIPWTVLNELDGLKKDNRVSYKVSKVVKKLNEYSDNVRMLSEFDRFPLSKNKTNDDKILEEIQNSQVPGLILISNDAMLRFKAAKLGIPTEEFKQSNPFLSESQTYSGFINEDEDLINNCFFWESGKLFYNKQGKEKMVDYENKLWTLTPKSPQQNALMELILDENVDLVSVQSEAGFGKTTLALAGAIELLMNEKDESNIRKYKKIYVFRPNVEIGQELGFLPGGIDEKMDPYFRPITDLLEMLNEKKKISKIWKKSKNVDKNSDEDLVLNKRKFEMLPINYLRGMNLQNCIVIIDEAANLTREQGRTVLSRMGKDVKCIVTGDVNQVDNPYCNEMNNMLNWIVVKFKGCKNYAHITLTGKNSRGPIADLTRNMQL